MIKLLDYHPSETKLWYICTGVSLQLIDRREWELEGLEIFEDAPRTSTSASYLQMARDANRCQCSHVRHSQHLQRAAGLSSVLAHIFHYGSAVLRREVLQMPWWIRRTPPNWCKYFLSILINKFGNQINLTIWKSSLLIF